jgi:hypothetical protein
MSPPVLEQGRTKEEIHMSEREMKLVSINSAPTIRDEDGGIRPDVTSLDAILSAIDAVEGRNDCIRAYVYALRDLQVAHNEGVSVEEDVDAAIDRAHAAVNKAFDALIVAEFAINRTW